MPQFAATVEAQYAQELRDTRDRTDDEIAREYRFTGTTRANLPRTVRRDRDRATTTRRTWITEAVNHAVSRACMDAFDAGYQTLDDMTVTVTVEDLVATAVLTLPESATMAEPDEDEDEDEDY